MCSRSLYCLTSSFPVSVIGHRHLKIFKWRILGLWSTQKVNSTLSSVAAYLILFWHMQLLWLLWSRTSEIILMISTLLSSCSSQCFIKPLCYSVHLRYFFRVHLISYAWYWKMLSVRSYNTPARCLFESASFSFRIGASFWRYILLSFPWCFISCLK